MKMKTLLIALALVGLGHSALADETNSQSSELPATLTNEQLQKGIATLLEEGVIEWRDGHFVVKNQNALDQLRQRGRVDLEAAAFHVVCY